MGDVIGGAHPAHGNSIHESFLPLRAPAFPLGLVVGAGAQEPGRYGVHRYAELAEFMGELAYQSELAVLGRRIGLDAGEAWRNRCTA